MYTCFCWDICSSSSTENCYWQSLVWILSSSRGAKSQLDLWFIMELETPSAYSLILKQQNKWFHCMLFFWHKGLTQSSCFIVLHMILSLTRVFCMVYVCIWNANNIQVEQLLCCTHCNSFVNFSHEIIMKKQNSCFTCNSYNYTSAGYLWASSFCLKGVLWFGFRGKMLHPKVLQVG